jgi:hypothetical protein
MVASLNPLGTAKSQPRSVASGGKRNSGESRFRHEATYSLVNVGMMLQFLPPTREAPKRVRIRAT